MTLRSFFCTVLFLSLTSALSAQQNSAGFTLEDIYTKGTFRSKGISNVRWMEGQDAYTTLEQSTVNGARDIVRYDALTGERSVVISASQLVPGPEYGALAGKPVVIEDYFWSEDHSRLMIFTASKRVWRYNTKGDFWVLDLAGGRLHRLAESLARSEQMFAKFSPEATKVAYVFRNNLYAEDLSSGRIVQLTRDGSDRIINGTFDWVYEEELDCRDGFRWSPDGRTIAFWQSDTEGTGVFYLINNIDSLYSKPLPFPYPKAGTTNSAVKVGVVTVPDNGPAEEPRWFDVPGDPRNHYLARMEFIPRSNTVMIQQLNRLQNTNRVFAGDVQTMQLNELMTDKDEAFLNIHDNIMWLDGEKSFTWTSEKDGWRHLYKVARDGRKEELITKGGFDVIAISCIDPRGGYVYYLASPDNATEQYLYRSRLDGRGSAERVTPAEALPGHHNYQISADARWAIHTSQNHMTPPVYELISLPGHKTVRVLEDNAVLKEKISAAGFSPKEFFRVDIGDAVLDGWMIKPGGFDPSQKYPVIFEIYGEPASSTVQNTWSGGDLWHRFLANQGYLVMSIDPRGTNMPKGRDWRKCIYGKVGIVAPADHAAAVLRSIEQFPFMDPSRIGIWGWSGGGSMTLNAMFKYPEIYTTGIAVAFVSLQELYDTIYQERYMGLPSGNPEGYRQGSPLHFAANLEGNLMLIHGTGDDNVHYQSFEMLVNELIKQNKIFSMMSYPMRSHGIYERENTTYHLYQTMLKYWLEHLPAGGKNTENAVIETIMARRSIRAYKDGPVERGKMDLIARCGINAPNAMNAQRWEVRIVDDPDFIAATTALYVEQMKNDPRGAQMVKDPSFKNMYRNAPSLVFIATENGEALIDCGLMAENMILAAGSMGIGSVCLGAPARFLTSPVAAEYLARLGFSEGYSLALVIGFGYPDESPAAKPRDQAKVKWIE